MSIPDVDIHIGDLYEITLMKYASGQLMIDGMIMTPDQALEHFKHLAVDEGFAVSTIENSAEELLYDLKDIEEKKYQQYIEEKEWKT